MALSRKDYEEIIQSAKAVKQIEKEIAEMVAKGVDKNDENFKLKKKQLEVDKARLNTLRSGNEELEAEYKAADKLFKLSMNNQRDILGLFGEQKKAKDLYYTRIQKIAEFEKKGQIVVSEGMKAIQGIENDILSIRNKSSLVSYDAAKALEEIEEHEATINEQLKKATGERAVALEAVRDELEMARKKVNAQREQSEAAKVQQKTIEKMHSVTGGVLDAMIGMKAAAIGFTKALLMNPLLLIATVLAGIVMLLIDGVKHAMDLQDSLGVAGGKALQLSKELYVTNKALKLIGVDGQKTATAIADEFGTISNVNATNVKDIGLMERSLGVASEDTAKFAKNFQSLTGETLQSSLNAVRFTAALSEANDVAPGAVMKDIAQNSEMFAEFGKDGGQNIAKAAVQARKLGLNLATTAKIANSLLDFESSIEKEMEASLMIGKQLNFNRARSLALEGDVAGAAKDVMNQIGGQAEFSKLNVLQRRALADSIGVSVDELSRLTSGSLEIKSGDKVKDVQAQQVKATETLNELLKKLTDWIQILVDTMKKLWGFIKRNSEVIIGLTAAFVAYKAAQMLGNLGGRMMNKFKGPKMPNTKPRGGFYDKNTGRFRQSDGKLLSDKQAKEMGLDKRMTKNVDKQAKDQARKIATKKMKQEAVEQGVKQTAKTGGKSMLKTGAKSFGKKLPFGLGLAVAGGFALDRFKDGDIFGGFGELTSGALSIIPVVGTAASLAVDAGLAVRDSSMAAKDASTDLSAMAQEDAKAKVEAQAVAKQAEVDSEFIGPMLPSAPTDRADLSRLVETTNSKAEADKSHQEKVENLLQQVITTNKDTASKVENLTKD